jgi:hypothetical protein
MARRFAIFRSGTGPESSREIWRIATSAAFHWHARRKRCFEAWAVYPNGT